MIEMDDVKQMLLEADAQTLTLYLDVDRGKQENQDAQPAWRIFLKDALDAAESQLKAVGVDRAIKDRVSSAFPGEYIPGVKGIAAFFTPTSAQVYELHVPVESHWTFGKPLVAPLLWALDEYEPYLIVMVDQEKAELMTAYLGSTKVEDRLETDLYEYDFGQRQIMPSTTAVQGNNRENFNAMINEHINRFYREVVDHIENLLKRQPKIRIILGGAEGSALRVRELLPEHIAKSVVATMAIPMHLNRSEVFDLITPVAFNYEREQEMALVQEVIDFAKSGGRGALGRKDVDMALTMRRVETLLLPWPAEDETEANDLSARTFESGGRVELIHGAAADRLAQEGGIGARLYYAL